MSQFMDEALNAANSELNIVVNQQTFDIDCPKCHKPINGVQLGMTNCPYCECEIELMPDVKLSVDVH